MKTGPAHPLKWHIWHKRLMTALVGTEARFDLEPGEILTASGTRMGDLQELWSYGWTPTEAAMAIAGRLGFR